MNSSNNEYRISLHLFLSSIFFISVFKIHLATLCLLIREFDLFIFKVILDR